MSVQLEEFCNSELSTFHEVTVDEVREIVMKSMIKSSPLDPVPTSVMKRCLELLLPHFAGVINASLLSGVMP